MKNNEIHVFGPTYIDYTIRLRDELSLDGSSRIESENVYAGGTGLCYAIALSRLENKVVLHSIIGTDQSTNSIFKLLEKEINIKTNWQIKDAQTDYAYVLIDRGNHKAVASNKVLSNYFETGVFSKRDFRNTKAIVLTSFSNNIIVEILKKITRFNIEKLHVMWAPHLSNCENAELLVNFFSKINHITLSIEEFKTLYKKVGNPIKYGTNTITVTNGKNGCELLTKNGSRHFNATYIVKHPLDTNGAGEAFGAGFLTTFLETEDLDLSVRKGSYVGYLHIQRYGSDFPSVPRKQLLKFNVRTLLQNNISTQNEDFAFEI